VTIERLLEAGRAFDAGELERAEQIYRQVVEADPQSSIAVVGLARIALSRGAGDQAARLAQTALSIDPGNAAAWRLLAGDLAPKREALPGEGTTNEPPGKGTTGEAASAEAWPAGVAAARASSSGDPAPAAGAAFRGDPAAAALGSQEPDPGWPWPDLEEQLARYRRPAPGLLARLLRRGR
jgi:hypothetical protein